MSGVDDGVADGNQSVSGSMRYSGAALPQPQHSVIGNRCLDAEP